LIKASHQHPGAQNKETMMTFTDDQLKKLSIFPHFTAMLSICGSLLIIFEVLTDFRKRGKVSAKSYNTIQFAFCLLINTFVLTFFSPKAISQVDARFELQ
jgi:hypothetical protein